MKIVITIKTGYSAGVYGCSAEYFTTIAIDEKGSYYFCYEGLYGAEERITELFTKAGYKQEYAGAFYGKLSRKDGKYSKSETIAIVEVKEFLANRG